MTEHLEPRAVADRLEKHAADLAAAQQALWEAAGRSHPEVVKAAAVRDNAEGRFCHDALNALPTILSALRAPRPVELEAVEAVARALCRNRWPDVDLDGPTFNYPKQWMHFEGDARAALAALRPADPGPGVEAWQPIETAPRDGTTIVMWDGNGLRDRVVVGAYDALAKHPWRFLDNPFRLTGQEHDGDGMCNAFLREPTHWRPLPAVPGALPQPASGDALTALRAVMGVKSVQTLFREAEEYPEEYPGGEEDVADELAALKLARTALARPAEGDARADVERGAIELFMRLHDDDEDTWDDLGESGRQQYRDAASAVLRTALAQGQTGEGRS